MKSKPKYSTPKPTPSATPAKTATCGGCGQQTQKSRFRILTSIPTPTASCAPDSSGVGFNIEVVIGDLGLAPNEQFDVVVEAELWDFPAGSNPVGARQPMTPDTNPANVGGFITSFPVAAAGNYFATVFAKWTAHIPDNDVQNSDITTC